MGPLSYPGAPVMNGMPEPMPAPMPMPPPPILEPQVIEVRPKPVYHQPSARDRAIVQQALERKEACEEFEGAWRAHYRHDTAFAAGENQWEGQVAPSGQQRVQLTLNQCMKYVHAVVNNGREHPPETLVKPVGSGADKETARMLEGYLRHVKKISHADEALSWGLTCAAVGGKGYWRIVLEYEDWGDTRAFYQVPKIQRVVDPCSVYLDFTARRDPDYHTAQWGFVIERLSKQWVTERYEIDHGTYSAWMLQAGGWVQRDECLLADYYCVEAQPVLLLQLDPQTIRYVPQIRETEDETEHAQQMALLRVVSRRLAQRGTLPLQPGEEAALGDPQLLRRQSFVPVVWQYKLTGTAILESTLWPGQYIPIIPVLGEEVLVEDRPDYRGLIRNVMEAQRLVNYFASRGVETVALGARGPYVGPAGFERGFEAEWQAMENGAAIQRLHYNSQDSFGAPIPPGSVQRDVQEPPIQATMLMFNAALDLVKTTIGIPDPELGVPSTGERTGIAIQRRQRQSSLVTAHYYLNMQRSSQYTDIQLVDLFPQVMVEPGRVLRILGEDEQERQIQLQPGLGPPQTVSTAQQPLPPDISGLYDPAVWQYDVVISPLPSYRTQREEAQEKILQTAQVVPQAAATRPDLLVEGLDFPKAAELARSLLRVAVPPGAVDPQDGKTPEDRAILLEQQVNQLTAQMQQAQQMISQQQVYVQETTQENDRLKLELTNKQGALQLEAQQTVQKAQQDQAELSEQHRVRMAELALEQSKVEAQRLKDEADLAWEKQKFYLELELKRAELRQDARLAETPSAREGDDGG